MVSSDNPSGVPKVKPRHKKLTLRQRQKLALAMLHDLVFQDSKGCWWPAVREDTELPEELSLVFPRGIDP